VSDLKETLARIRDEAARNGEACAHTRLTDLLENWPTQTDDGAVLNTLEEPAPSSPTHGLDRDAVAKVLRGHWLNQDGVYCTCGAWVADMYSLHLADAVLATAVDLRETRAQALEEAVALLLEFREFCSPKSSAWKQRNISYGAVVALHDRTLREMGADR